jgi:hypothetical protein
MKRIVHSILFNRGLIFALLALLFLAGNVVSVQAQEEPILVDSWGFLGGRTAGWGISVGEPGNVTISGDTSLTSGWSAIRGEFGPVTVGEGQALVVSGKIETVGQGLNAWSALRYGVFRHDSTGTLFYADTDSAFWGETLYEGTDSARVVRASEGFAYGYLLTNHSGTNDRVTWSNGNGNVGPHRGGVWISTFNNNPVQLGLIDQRLFRAVAPEGVYDFAISIHEQDDGNNQVRFYLIHEDGEYWFGGIVIDTTGVPTDTYNSINLAINADSDDMTAIHYTEITVALGEPVTLPNPPLEMPPHDIGRILNDNRIFDLSAPGPASGPFWWFATGNTVSYDVVYDDAQTGDRSVRIEFDDAHVGNSWDIEAVNDPINPGENDIIRASVWLKADTDERVANLYIGLPGDCGWARPVSQEVTLTTEWAMYQIPDYPVTAYDADCAVRFGIELNFEENAGGVISLDNAIVRKVGEFDPTKVTSWGFIPGRINGWQISVGDPGNVNLSTEAGFTGEWAGVRGEFGPLTVTEGQALRLSGKLDFVGQGPDAWSALRYGVFRQDSAGVVEYAGTDSALWSGSEGFSYGYMITNHSGTNDRVSWSNGNGNIGVHRGGVWLSTFNNNPLQIGLIDQRLFRAEAPEGMYDFGISIHQQEDGHNQVRFYLIHEDGEYWFGGLAVDTSMDTLDIPTEIYNSFCFAFNNRIENVTAVNLIDISVDIGDPLPLPNPPLEQPTHDIGRILNDNRTFELSSPGVTEGTALWSFNRTASGANAVFEIVTDEAQTGDRSLRIDFGTWNGTSDAWNVEAVSEPFYPAAGDSIRLTVWMKADEDGRIGRLYLGLPESGGWQRVPNWGMEVICTLTTEWQMFSFPDYLVIPRDVTHSSQYMRAGVEFNLQVNDGGMFWIDNMIVRKIGELPISVDEEPAIPLVFALEQNYPNPFNPTTQIQFSLPEQADVLLEVYDVLGRRVATLINNDTYNAGWHSVTWDATNQSGRTISSGLYIYRLQAGNRVDVKRMMFIK